MSADLRAETAAAEYWNREDRTALLAIEHSDALVEALSSAPGLDALRQGITGVLLAFLDEATGQGEGLERRQVRVVTWPRS
jgi:hypothetical protein